LSRFFPQPSARRIHQRRRQKWKQERFVRDEALLGRDATLLVREEALLVRNAALFVHNAALFVRNATRFVREESVLRLVA
jgi:hypothetical protein